jgi:hypothetical protein
LRKTRNRCRSEFRLDEPEKAIQLLSNNSLLRPGGAVSRKLEVNRRRKRSHLIREGTEEVSGLDVSGPAEGEEVVRTTIQPGAPGRHYPVETARNRALNDRYRAHVAGRLGQDRTFFAGRLAGYRYLDMDDCMRQALDGMRPATTSSARRSHSGRQRLQLVEKLHPEQRHDAQTQAASLSQSDCGLTRSP